MPTPTGMTRSARALTRPPWRRPLPAQRAGAAPRPSVQLSPPLKAGSSRYAPEPPERLRSPPLLRGRLRTRLLTALTGLAALTLVGGLLLAWPGRAGAAADPLISRGKPATASSTESSSLGAKNAFDGDPATRWASTEGKDPQWIRVDLGAGATVSRVRLTWEAAYAKAYRVEVSADGAAWTALADETAGNGGVDDWTGLSGKGRYLRVQGTARGTSYGYSLFEAEVYGTVGGGPQPGAPSRSSPPGTSPRSARRPTAAARTPRPPRSPSGSTRSST